MSCWYLEEFCNKCPAVPFYIKPMTSPRGGGRPHVPQLCLPKSDLREPFFFQPITSQPKESRSKDFWTNDKTHHPTKQLLVGGWTNPIEKYARQIGSFSQVGVKMKNHWNHYLDHQQNRYFYYVSDFVSCFWEGFPWMTKSSFFF